MSDQIVPSEVIRNENAANNNTPTTALSTDCQVVRNNNETSKLGSDDNAGITNKLDEVKLGVDCPICLQKCVYPVQLPCTHIFCFLCAKGNAQRSNRCALCRQDIPQDFFFKPKLMNTEEVVQTLAFDNGFQWYYEGRNGWWQYDLRASRELEKKYKRGDRKFEMLIAGWLYIIDLENMVQFRKNSEGRKRKVKRDLINIPEKKGVAGLKLQSDTRSGRPDSDGEAAAAPLVSTKSLNVPANGDNVSVADTDSNPPPNTPQNITTPEASPSITPGTSHQDLSAHLEDLSLGTRESLESPSNDDQAEIRRRDNEESDNTRSTYI